MEGCKPKYYCEFVSSKAYLLDHTSVQLTHLVRSRTETSIHVCVCVCCRAVVGFPQVE